jgi:hypothetical protein
MNKFLFLAICFWGVIPPVFSQCKIALDTWDEFDSTHLIATEPLKLGFLVPTQALAEDLEGAIYTEEAKAIFSFANENKIRSFFLTLGVVERKFYMPEKGFTVLLKFTDGVIAELYNVPTEGEFDRDILMWNYMHTAVVPLEIFHMMRNVRVEKIRINYKNYKSTIVLEEAQQAALQKAVMCVEERLNKTSREIRP